jgi:hypothetical protein
VKNEFYLKSDLQKRFLNVFVKNEFYLKSFCQTEVRIDAALVEDDLGYALFNELVVSRSEMKKKLKFKKRFKDIKLLCCHQNLW